MRKHTKLTEREEEKTKQRCEPSTTRPGIRRNDMTRQGSIWKNEQNEKGQTKVSIPQSFRPSCPRSRFCDFDCVSPSSSHPAAAMCERKTERGIETRKQEEKKEKRGAHKPSSQLLVLLNLHVSLLLLLSLRLLLFLPFPPSLLLRHWRFSLKKLLLLLPHERMLLVRRMNHTQLEPN